MYSMILVGRINNWQVLHRQATTEKSTSPELTWNSKDNMSGRVGFKGGKQRLKSQVLHISEAAAIFLIFTN